MIRRAGLVAMALALAACGGSAETTTSSQPTDAPATTGTEAAPTSAAPTTAGETETTAVASGPDYELPTAPVTELVITDLKPGEGPAAVEGDGVIFRLIATLVDDGNEIVNNFVDGQTFSYLLGSGTVIEAWDQGLVGVQAGMIRQLDVPSALAFGETGDGQLVPPDADMTFVFEIIEVSSPPLNTLAERADDAQCPAADGSSPQQREFEAYPPTCIDLDATYSAEVVTNHGSFTIELDAKAAPLAVNSFVVLARSHYFDSITCHRAIPGFVVQCGDPTGTGTGGPGYSFADELPEAGAYQIGSIAMANSGPNTNGSQFFVITGDSGAALPPNYSLFGQVTDGLDSTVADLDALGNPESNGVPPLEEILIESITITQS